MPVTREDRFMYASRDGLSRHLGREAGLAPPVHIAGSLAWIQILVNFELPMMPEECLGSAERAA
jgi:hypothetical protein